MDLSRKRSVKASAVFDVKEAIKSIFAAFDADGNGSLDRQELETFARAFRKNEELNDGEDNVDKMMAAMDFKNSDGTVQIEEFETYLQATPAHALFHFSESLPSLQEQQQSEKALLPLYHKHSRLA